MNIDTEKLREMPDTNFEHLLSVVLFEAQNRKWFFELDGEGYVENVYQKIIEQRPW